MRSHDHGGRATRETDPWWYRETARTGDDRVIERSEPSMHEYESAARALGLSVVASNVTGPESYAEAFARSRRPSSWRRTHTPSRPSASPSRGPCSWAPIG